MKLACGVTIEDLFDYREDRLRGARGEYIEVHVRHCEICREQLDLLDKTTQLLAPAAATRDDPASRDRIIREIQRQDSEPRSAGWLNFDSLWPRVLLPGALVVALLILVWPTASQADPGIAGAVRDMVPGMARSLPEGEEPPGTPLRGQELSPFVTPIELPGGFTLYHAEGEGHERLELRYEDEEGRDFLLVQTSLDSQYEVYSNRHWTEYIDDTQVLVGPGPYQGYLNGASWEREGMRFHLRPLVPGAVSEEQAEAIVRHVMQVQDERSDQNGG